MRSTHLLLAAAAAAAVSIAACSGSDDGGAAPPPSSTPDGGSPDGGSTDDGGSSNVTPYVPSPEIQALVAELDKLAAGQPADLDGDGTPDATKTTNPDGSYTFTGDHDADGTPEYVLEDDTKGNQSITIDADADGTPEQTLQITVTATTHQQVLTVDSDLNGAMDHRYTWKTDKATLGAQAYTEEADAAETGTFTTTQTLTLMTSKHDGSGCDGDDNFPEGGEDYQPVKNGPTIETGDSPGACNFGDKNSIATALDCALTKGAKCLASTNSREYDSVMAALGGAMTHLDIGCGNSCAGVVAATRGWSSPWFSDSTMNINPGEWDKLDSDGKCNAMLHELMHWAGDQGSADHNDDKGAGNDAVYSCGRYCGNCSHALHGSKDNSSVDCAYCSDTLDRKKKCGLKQGPEKGSCNGQLTGLCHAGLGCIAADCEECMNDVTKTCDDKEIEREAKCCATCPVTCNASNDLPCGGGSSMSTDTCTDATPPNCH